MTMERDREHVRTIHIKAGEGAHDALIRSIRQNVIASTGIDYGMALDWGTITLAKSPENLRKTDSDLCIYIQRQQGS